MKSARRSSHRPGGPGEPEARSGTDRRRDRRTSRRLPLTIESVTGVTTNLSEQGLAVRVPLAVEPGALVRGELAPPEGAPLPFQAEVRWVRRGAGGGPAAPTWSHLGLRLRHPIGEAHRRLLDAAAAIQPGATASYGELLAKVERLSFFDRLSAAAPTLQNVIRGVEPRYLRQLVSPCDREVLVVDPTSRTPRRMLMFGSNNYLGLANHPHVRERVEKAVRTYGPGLGSVPLLGGYSVLHREVEERLSDFKSTEDTVLFSSGYVANLALATALFGPRDVVVVDEFVHASLCDGLKAGAQGRVLRFRHNHMGDLGRVLERYRPDAQRDVFLAIEGVYSMAGDVAPLDEIVPLCRRRGLVSIIDDAHGDGVMGPTGRGTPEHFGVEGQIDVVMGTLSKAFAAVGGFVSGSRDLVDYLRVFGRAYVFSTSLPPPVLATVLGGLEVIEREPERVLRLQANVRYARAALARMGIEVRAHGAILPLRLPRHLHLHDAARRFDEAGIFVNPVEYPAVPVGGEIFRVNLMATHTRDDIDRLLATIEEIWSSSGPTEERPAASGCGLGAA